MKHIIKPFDIYIPNKDVDFSKWSVIACDQFTSDKSYWKSLEKYIRRSPSTLNLILPEIYLNSKEENKRLSLIKKMSKSYLKDGTLVSLSSSFVLVDRNVNNIDRIGLILPIDLEAYSYKKEDKPLIFASEKTVVERIPPRLKVRENSYFELPHVLLLFNDKNKVISTLFKNRKKLEKLYDFELNSNGGHLTGYKVKNTKEIISKIEPKVNKKVPSFLVGDGNHSLGTAKKYWDNIKVGLTKIEKLNHPARYALVELVDINESGVIFYPINRVLFNVKSDFAKFIKDKKPSTFEFSKKRNSIVIKNKKLVSDTYKEIDVLLEEFLVQNKDVKIDYIHDTKETLEMAKSNKNSIAILMPSLSKNEFLKVTGKYNILPKKCFSIGHANEKKYYFECKKIRL